MKATATAKFVGTSTRKLGLVAGLIRGSSAAHAQITLGQASKRAAGTLSKVLDSAIANAQNVHNLKKADLVVESVLIGPAPMLKRFRPRAKGSASSIHKRSSHITVIVSDQKVQATKESVTKEKGATTSPTKTKSAKLEQK